MKNVFVLGACGNIGHRVIDILIKHSDMFNIVGVTLSRHNEKNIKLLEKIKPEFAILQNDNFFEKYSKKYLNIKFEISNDSINKHCQDENIDIVINSLSGVSGILPSYYTILSSKKLILANKESMVVAGRILTKLARENNVEIIPIDSEHNALFNLINSNKNKKFDKYIITASGGALRDYNRRELYNIKPIDALKHPTWQMSPKITIDSATMVNKAFEVIEAAYLFDISYKNIIAKIEKTSNIHACLLNKEEKICFKSENDMIYPIENAILYPTKFIYNKEYNIDDYDFFDIKSKKYPLFKYGYKVLKSKKDYYGAVLLGINDASVKLFLENKINYLDIEKIVKKMFNYFTFKDNNDVEQLSIIVQFVYDYVISNYKKII